MMSTRMSRALVAGSLMAAGMSDAAPAQQRTMLDDAAKMLALASINPQGLVEARVMELADGRKREVLQREIVPCFRRIGNTYRAQQPALSQQCGIVARNMPNGNGNGTAACQAALNADGYVRATSIAELAITDPVGLPRSAEFQFNNNAHIALVSLINAMPPALAQSSAAQIEQLMQVQVGTYKQAIQQTCLPR